VRFVAFAAALVALVGSGCSTPRTASGTLDAGKQRVTRLVLDTAHSLPPTVTFRPPSLVGTQPCRKTIAGYVVGKTGARRAEVPLIVYTPTNESVPSLLGQIEDAWRRAGYRLDLSRSKEGRFPQVRATTPDGDNVVATAFAAPFTIKNAGESYTDYVRRAKAAGIDPMTEFVWSTVPVGRQTKSTLIATQIDLYSVSQCLRGS
jgi:hypothetical protein